MKQEKHNPDYKLVSVALYCKNGWKELVYGITNDGKNEGLEVYHHRENELHHYQSFRYNSPDIPAKYRSEFVMLREYVRQGQVQPGNKLNITPMATA